MESSSQVDEIINQVGSDQKADEFISSNGVKFKLYKVSNLLIIDATKRIPRPQVPSVYLEEKGRTEENPSDPDYIQAMQNYNAERSLLVSSLIVAFGCKTVEKPERFDDVENTDWSNDLESFGVTIPSKGKARYSAWIRYHLLDSDEELAELIKKIMRYSGVTLQNDVKEAEESFRSDQARNTS